MPSAVHGPKARYATEDRSGTTVRIITAPAWSGRYCATVRIGRRLHMSETTIKTYMTRILAKLDCLNRVQAALLVRDADPRA
jgi:hypothetical protein